MVQDLSSPYGHDGFVTDGGPAGFAQIEGLTVMSSCEADILADTLSAE